MPSDLDCGVCIDNDCGEDAVEFYSHTTLQARKPHRCSECGRMIQPGEQYHREAGKESGEMWSHHTCLTCYDIRKAFHCNGGWIIGCLWYDIQEWVFPSMTTGCLERLELPESKEVLMEKWVEWKGLR